MDSTLGSIQLNNEESEVYKTVLVSGQLSLAEILDSTSLNEDGISTTIETLISKKLLRRVPGMIDRFACLLPLGSTKDELEKASEQVALLGREIDAAADEQVNKLQTQLEEAQATLQTQTDAKIAELNEAASSLKSTISTHKSSTTESIATDQSSGGQTVDDTVQKVSSSAIETATKFQGAAAGRIISKSEWLIRTITEAKVVQDSIRGEAGADMQELDMHPLENSKTESIASISRVFSNGSESLQSVHNTMESAVGTIKTGFDEQVSGVSAAGEEFNSKSGGLFTQARTDLASQVANQQEALGGLQSSLAETTQSIASTLDAGIAAQSTLEQQTTEKLTTVETQLSQSIDSLQSSMNTSVESSSASISQFVDESTASLGSHQAELEQSVSSLLETQKDQIKSELQTTMQTFVDQTHQQLDQLMATFSSQITEKAATLNQQRSQLQEQTKSSLSSQTANIASQVSQQISAAKSSQQEVFERARQDVSELSKQQQDQLGASKTSLMSTSESMTTQFGQVTTGLNQWNESVQQQLQSHIEEQTKIFNNVLQSALSSIRQQADSEATTLSTQISETFASVSAQLQESQNQASQQIESAITETITAISSLHQNMKERFNSAVDKSRDQYNGLIDSNSSSMSELITQLEQDTAVIKEDLSTTMTQHLGEVQTQLKQLLSSSFAQVNTMVNAVSSAIDQQVSQAEAVGNQVIQSVADLSAQGTSSQIDAVKGTFTTYGDKYKETTNTVSEKVTALATILDTIFKLQEDTPTPNIKTSHVVGKPSIIKYVNEMVSRVKSKMTILVPDISMIRDSKILEMPRTAQITIVSNIDEVSDKDWIEKMHAANANVTLRTLTQQGGFGAQLPDFIGGEREGEEIIIGTLDEGNNDYVAVASNSEYFVKIFGSQIISEYARGRSKQLQK